jgi:VanZ family protein
MFRPSIYSSRILLIISVALISFLAIIETNQSSSSLINDKLLHFLCFVFLTIVAKLTKYVNQNFLLYGIVLTYGILIEIVQMYLPYRSFESLDILADFTGILFGGFLYKLVKDLYDSY